MGLSVIVPVYNESGNIKPLVESVSKALRKKGIAHEIVFVDDGSSDGTGEAILSMRKKHRNITYLNRHKKLGLSSAVVAGLKLSKERYVCVIDGDLQHDPKYLPQMYVYVKGTPGSIVIGSRFVKSLGNTQRLDSKIGTFICKHVLGISVQDPLSGFFMLERDKFISLVQKIRPVGYKILLEILAKGSFNKIKEVPIIFHMRKEGSSKLDLKTRLEFLIQILDILVYKMLNRA